MIVGAGLALEAVNQLDRWRRLSDGSYEPYGSSFLRAHALAYLGVALTICALVRWFMTTARPSR